MTKRENEKILNEIKFHSFIDHPNIPTLYEFFEDKDNYYLVFELCEEGDLMSYLQEKEKLTEEEACLIFTQLLQTINYLHLHRICHRDLKIENILIKNQNKKIFLTDFGSAEYFSPGKKMTEKEGTFSYLSPEQI